MSIDQDPYATWDAAYVLGALTPADRRDYQDHLAACESCRAGVADLAGLPGMLALVPEEVALSLVTDDGIPEQPAKLPAPPPALLHRLIDETRSRRRRARYLAIGAGIAAVAAAVAIAVPVTIALRPESSSHPGFSEEVVAARSMSSLEPTSLSANFELIALSDGGTRVDMVCRYDAGTAPRSYTGRYAMYVTAGGVETKLAEWEAKPGDVVTPTATTREAPSDIERVDIRSAATNKVVLVGIV